MRNIVLARIDDRLIHGQIVTSWCKTTNANKIVIADDELVKDDFTARLLKAAAPPDIAVIILSAADTVGYLAEESEKSEKIILLAKTPQLMETLIDGGIAFSKINLGGMGMKAGRKKFNKNISATPDEVACMKRLVERGIDIHYQLVPRELPVNVKRVLLEE